MRGYFRQFFYTASVPRPVSGIFPWISAQMSSVVQSAPRVSPRCWTYKTLYRPSSAWIVSSVLNAGQIDLDGCSAFDRGIEQAARDDALECLLRQSDQSGLCVQYHRLAGKITVIRHYL